MKGGRGEGTAAIESCSANIRGDHIADSDFVWWEGKSCFSYEDFVIFLGNFGVQCRARGMCH